MLINIELDEIDSVVKKELGLSVVNPIPLETRAVYFGLVEREKKEDSMF